MPTSIQSHHEVSRDSLTRISYTARGPRHGGAIVFVHGWGCCRHDFDDLIHYLPDNHRVLAIDLAEHGDSRSTRTSWSMDEFGRDIVSVLEAEGIRDSVIVGHSLGGAAAVEAAALSPDSVSRVVALDALHYMFLFPPLSNQQEETALAPFRNDFSSAVRGMVEAGSPAGTEEELIEAYVEQMSSVRQPAGLKSMEGLVHWDMNSALARANQPITVFAVHSLLSPQAVEKYGDRITFVPIELGSHHFAREAPEETAQVLMSEITGRDNT